MPKPAKNPADFILPLYMNGLSGRMLRMPPPKGKKSEILYIYGHHASLERLFGVAEYLNKYSGVTVPDLPGFGGMEPFYKIGEKPTLDNMADYLASFVKLRYKNKRFSIAGLSLGFMVATRMLQKYPEIAKKVDILVSFAGLTHKDDFKFKRRNFLIFRYGSSLFSNRPLAAFGKYIVLRGPVIRLGYRIGEAISLNAKLATLGDRDHEARINFEIHLWQCNDFRTYLEMAVTMLTLDLTKQHVDLPVHHIAVDSDHYFDSLRVEQHMRMIYSDFYFSETKVPAHTPSVIATAKEAAPYVPKTLIRLLNKLN